MQRILIVRMGALGDVIHALPAAATLKAAFPGAEIDWVIERHWAPLLRRNPHLAEVHAVDTGAWRRNLAEAGTWRSIVGSLKVLRARRYDCALDFQGLIKSAAMARLSGAARVVGFSRPELREPIAEFFYTERVRLLAESRRPHVVEKNLRLAAQAGALQPRIVFPLEPSPADERAVCILLHGIPRYVVLSPNAGWPAKRWPAAKYAQLADALEKEAGLRAVLNCGPGDDAIVRDVEAGCSSKPVVVRPGIGELIALMRGAALVVAGDTGPLHVAAACGAPVIGVFGPTDPARNGPFTARARVVRADAAQTTYARNAGAQTIAAVPVDRVLAAALELLESQ